MTLTDTTLTMAGDIRTNNLLANESSLNIKGDLVIIRGTNLMPMLDITPRETIMYNDVVINDRLLTSQYIGLETNLGI